MNYFDYRDGQLFAEEVAISDIAAAVGTPFYCYSTATLTNQYQEFAAAMAAVGARVCYAIKANSNQAVIRTLAELGAGADVVSGGELRRAIAAGIAPQNIVFSGVGKTQAELEYALSTGIGQINVESKPELDAIDKAAEFAGVEASIALRVNPDVDAHTHDKISTGRKDDKFGIEMNCASSLYARATEMSYVRPVGLAVHIGSQLTTLQPFKAAFSRVAKLIGELRANGLQVERLDLGGGLGITYQDEQPPDPNEYADVISETTKGLDVELTVEPGRHLVGNAGILVTAVIFNKNTSTKRLVVVDAAMNDLIRPSLYDAVHSVIPVVDAGNSKATIADVVGPVCETGDVLATDTALPTLETNDLLAIKSAGAYGAVMSSTYNSRLSIAEVMVKDNKYFVIRPRTDYEALLSLDRIPSWLGN